MICGKNEHKLICDHFPELAKEVESHKWKTYQNQYKYQILWDCASFEKSREGRERSGERQRRYF